LDQFLGQAGGTSRLVSVISHHEAQAPTMHATGRVDPLKIGPGASQHALAEAGSWPALGIDHAQMQFLGIDPHLAPRRDSTEQGGHSKAAHKLSQHRQAPIPVLLSAIPAHTGSKVDGLL
jgi:hypothetical protein